MSATDPETLWFPIANSTDLVPRHVFHGQLLGREMAVWRADDGFVNVWENRCLHRGVRLSIGINDGRELTCIYHGWRYANRTAGCTYIPAHPADAPARTICNNTYTAVEAHGLIWSCLRPSAPFAPPVVPKGTVVLRPIPVNAAPELVMELARGYAFSPTGSPDAGASEIHAEGVHYLCLSATEVDVSAELTLFVQPVDRGRAVLRGVVECAGGDETVILRHHNRGLQALRDRVEAEAARRPAPVPIEVSFARIDPELASMPAHATAATEPALRVRVVAKRSVATGVAAFDLEPLDGRLPTFQPGAHIDVHLPNGLTRQYSLTNAPGETGAYRIAVKREPASRGGSACLHEVVRQGDILAISAPHTGFPLRRDAVRTLLIAGGIGITPLIAMAQTLHLQALPFDLHAFAQSSTHLAFPEILERLGGHVHPHLGLDPEATEAALHRILDGYDYAHHIYVCGPAPMLEATRRIAAEHGWPEDAVHFEYFRNTRKIDDRSTFEVALARSALTLQVPAGKSILEVMRENGVLAASSCEQGACGTCLATVLEGEPDHQDVYLSESERRANTRILTCVSRAKSRRLVLDI